MRGSGQSNAIVASGNAQSFNSPATTRPRETGQFIACTFTNSAPRLVVSKSVVPPSNTWVNPGQSLTYTLAFDNSGGGQPAAVNYTDDLTKVLDDATVTTPPALATGSGLTVSGITAGKFTVTGTLAARATATVTYTVTVINPDTGDHQLVNFVVPTGTSPPPTCLPTNPDLHYQPHTVHDLHPDHGFRCGHQGGVGGTEKTGASAYDTASVTTAGVDPNGHGDLHDLHQRQLPGDGRFGGQGDLDGGRAAPDSSTRGR